MAHLKLTDVDKQAIQSYIVEQDTASVMRYILKLVNNSYQNGINKGYADAMEKIKKGGKKW